MPPEADALMPVLAGLARALLAAPFLLSAALKLRDWAGGLAEVRALGLPLPAGVLAATVVLQLGGGAMLVTNWHARWAAAALAGFTLLATLMAHPVWRHSGPGAAPQRVAFSEHLAIIGGLLLVVAHG